MRGDLRRLYWRLSAGVIRRAVLEEAIEEACVRLVDDRSGAEVPFQEVSPFTRHFLVRFEKEISLAQTRAPEGDHYGAIRALEAAEETLHAARRIAAAHEDWEATVGSWAELRERFDLNLFAHLATVREVSRGLALTESFLEVGDARKARFVVRLCRGTITGITALDSDPERRNTLVRRLVALQRTACTPPESFLRILGRIADEGFLGFAERLVDDWEIGAGTIDNGTSGRPASSGVLEKIGEAGREAWRLARELADLPSTGEGLGS